MDILKRCGDVVYCLVIVSTCNRIISHKYLNIYTLYIQICITMVRVLANRNISPWNAKMQILLSTALTSAFGEHKLYVVSWLYLIKIIYIHSILKDIRQVPIFNRDGLYRYCAFVYDVLRYTLILRLFIKTIMMLYYYSCSSK